MKFSISSSVSFSITFSISFSTGRVSAAHGGEPLKFRQRNIR